MKLSKETEFTLSIQSLVGMGFLVFTLVSFWFTVQAQIDGKLDKKDYIIPDPPISRVEFDIKDKMVRNQIKRWGFCCLFYSIFCKTKRIKRLG